MAFECHLSFVIVITCMHGQRITVIEELSVFFIILFDVFELAVSRCQISVKSMYMCPVEPKQKPLVITSLAHAQKSTGSSKR